MGPLGLPKQGVDLSWDYFPGSSAMDKLPSFIKSHSGTLSGGFVQFIQTVDDRRKSRQLGHVTRAGWN
jgi:hypothetical protein